VYAIPDLFFLGGEGHGICEGEYLFFAKEDSQTFSYKLGFEPSKTVLTDGPGVFRIET
jgi:hypothetical protein